MCPVDLIVYAKCNRVFIRNDNPLLGCVVSWFIRNIIQCCCESIRQCCQCYQILYRLNYSSLLYYLFTQIDKNVLVTAINMSRRVSVVNQGEPDEVIIFLLLVSDWNDLICALDWFVMMLSFAALFPGSLQFADALEHADQMDHLSLPNSLSNLSSAPSTPSHTSHYLTPSNFTPSRLSPAITPR